MPALDLHKLIGRLVTDAVDKRLEDAAFRARAERTARQLQRVLGQAADGRRQAAGARRPAYRFIAVPNSAGGTSCVSVSSATFEELARALGGDTQVSALARKVAAGHRPETGVSRSAYVVKRLRQRAARTVR